MGKVYKVVMYSFNICALISKQTFEFPAMLPCRITHDALKSVNWSDSRRHSYVPSFLFLYFYLTRDYPSSHFLQCFRHSVK